MKLSEITPLYSPLDVEYSQAMSGPYRDLCMREDEYEIVAGLKNGRIDGFWRPMVAVGNETELKQRCEELWLLSQDWYYMDFLINGELSVVSKFLLEKGYRSRPVYTRVIDLSVPGRELHSSMRKSYKSLVNKCGNLDYGQIKDYAPVHEVYGGHERPDATWDIQQKMIDNNEAFVLTDGPDCSVLIYCNGKSAYYAGGRARGDMHAAVWHGGVVRSKIRGTKVFEFGEQVYHVGQVMMDGTRAGTKHINISKFKAGFGGKTMTRLILEK